MVERLKIFVSGKQGELDNERAIIIELIDKLGFQPIASERFTAVAGSMEQAWNKEVRNSNIYVGIFGFCHSEASIGEFYAAADKPRLINVKILGKETVREPKLQNFLDTISDPKNGVVVYKPYSLVTDLRTNVHDALINAITEGFRGTVRGQK